MTHEAVSRIPSARRFAVAIGVVAAVAAAVVAWLHPAALLPAYRFAGFACLAPALGSLVFLLIHRLTGGEWGDALAPYFGAGTALLPWVWVLILPLLWIVPSRFGPTPEMSGLLAAYFSHRALVFRALVYAVAFVLFWRGARRVLRSGSSSAMPWFGPAGLISLVFLLHFLSVDWFYTLEPGWFSTGFGLVWTTAQAIAGLALAIGTALLGGFRPAAKGAEKRARGLDWGNLLLAAVLSWTYVAFVEFLIIWSGNLPPEIAWYLHRGHGGWRILVIALALLQVAVPFALLLSREVKQRTLWLGGVAGLLVLGEFGYTAWLILPAFHPTNLPTVALAGLVAVAAFAFFWIQYVGAIERPPPARRDAA